MWFQAFARITGTAFVLVLAACSAGDIPATPTPLGGPSQSSSISIGDSRVASVTGAQQVVGDLPSWILNPVALPPGRVGKNNCTFQFPAGYQWNAHPEGGCWEHPGPDGWFRQQFQKIHIPNFASCGGGPGDATAIRVCRLGGQGQPQPCFIDPTTGPNGCARCVVNPECH